MRPDGPQPRDPRPRGWPVAGPIASDEEARTLERAVILMELKRRLVVSLPRRR